MNDFELAEIEQIEKELEQLDEFHQHRTFMRKKELMSKRNQEKNNVHWNPSTIMNFENELASFLKKWIAPVDKFYAQELNMMINEYCMYRDFLRVRADFDNNGNVIYFAE